MGHRAAVRECARGGPYVLGVVQDRMPPARPRPLSAHCPALRNVILYERQRGGPGHVTGHPDVTRVTGPRAGDPNRSGFEKRPPEPATNVAGMDITIHTTALPHDDPDASVAFYRDVLGFEVRSDVGQGKMRWITVGPVGQPGTSILLAPPAVDPGITEAERRTILEMMAKGTYGWILLATPDLDGTFEKVQAADAEVVQEPTDQPYGVRDCAFRDPAGNLVRIQERR
ncbi:hypothetical protein GCM10017750_33760 [Streptomyces racemochromogenes]